MKRWAPWIVVAAALAAGAWWLLDSRGSGPGGEDADRAADGGGAPPDAVGGAELRGRPGATDASGRGGTAAIAEATRGRSAIVGTVTRGGKPSPATVEVAFLFDPRGGTSSGERALSLFDRILDASPVSASATATTKAGPDGAFAVAGIAPGFWRVTAIAEDGARGSVQAMLPVDGARVEANPVLPGGAETLAGRAVRADGTPWTGLVLVDQAGGSRGMEIFVVSGEPVPTKEDGRFRVVGLDPGPYVVSAVEDDAFRAMGKPVAVPYAGEYLLVVDAGLGEVAGRVVADEDGKPVAGASVLGGGDAGALAFTVAKATTDADGRFKLMTPAGRGGWFVTAAGFAPAMMDRRGAVEGEVEIRLARAGKVEGRVTAEGDGKPVAGIAVNVVPIGDRGLPSFAPPATTDADGRYVVDDVAPGDAMAYAQSKGWVSPGLAEAKSEGYNPLSIRVEAGKTTKADLVVVRGARATGRVSDSSGAPVAGAVVKAQVENSPDRFGPFTGAAEGTTAASAADGTWSLDALPPGATVTFEATAPGHPKATAGPMSATADAPLKVDLVFPAARYVLVKVVEEESGAPVPGARVTWMTVSEGGRGYSGQEGDWVTGGDGTVRAGPLKSDVKGESIGFGAEAEGYVRRRGQPEPVPAGATQATVKIKRGLVIAGRARFTDGTAAVGAEVEARPADGEQGWARTQAGVEADGAFRLTGLSAGKYRLTVSVSRDGKPLTGEAAADAGDQSVVLTLTAAAATKEGAGKLTVRVVGPDGKSVPSADISLRSKNSTHGQSLRDGVATFDSMPSGQGEVWIEVSRPRSSGGTPLPYGAVKWTDLPARGGEVEIRLPAEKAVEGRVVGPDGRGVRGVQVAAFPSTTDRRYSSGTWGAHATQRTDDGGAFRLGGLGDESYRIEVQAPADYAPVEPLVAASGATDVVIRLRAGASAAVTVLDWRGQPVAGANVTASVPRKAEEPPSPVPSRAAQTDTQGVARLSGLEPGTRFALQVGSPSARKDLMPHSEDGWAPHDTSVRLARAYVVRGVVKDGDGKPVAGANVHRRTGPHAWSGTNTAADGTFALEGLQAGEVVLCATINGESPESPPPGGGPAPDPRPRVTVQAGAEDVVLTVDVGLEVTGKVGGWEEEHAWRRAMLLPEGPSGSGRSMHEQIADDGTFRFRGLRSDATYALWISPGSDGKSFLQTGIRAPADLRVRLVAGKSITGRVTSPPGSQSGSVQASDARGITVGVALKPDGTYEIRGLPEGRFTVTSGMQGPDGKYWQASVENVPAGGTADLELKPR